MPISEDTAKDIASRGSLRAYLELVTIACRPHPKPFGQVAEPWQTRDILGPLVPAVEHAAGLAVPASPYDTFWFTLPKGHDKTSLQGRVVCWLLNYARRRQEIYVVARDKYQAQSLQKAMFDEWNLNPWLPRTYKVNSYDAMGPSGTMELLSKDAKSGHGKRPTVLVCDEVTVWESQDLWDMTASSATKDQDCLLIVLCNAGYKHSWQHRLFLEYQKDPRCLVYEAPGVLASWINQKKVERARRTMTASEGRRLYDNEWVDSSEESAWPEDDINGVFRLNSPYEFSLPNIGAVEEAVS